MDFLSLGKSTNNHTSFLIINSNSFFIASFYFIDSDDANAL
jgi:hypothetical protein